MLALHKILDGLHRNGRVAAIGVCANGLAEFLVERRAAKGTLLAAALLR